MDDCWIGIGGNLGDAHVVFSSVWDQLRRQPEVVLKLRSGLYQTQPVGQYAGDSFTNAVFSLSTALSPIELLDRLQAIESELGRQRGVRWGARSIDLDILFIGQMVITETRLTVPHPGAWYRRFVIDPLVEVAPTLRHPQLNDTIAELHNRLVSWPLIAVCPETTTSDLRTEFGDIQSQFPQARLVGSDADSSATVEVRLSGEPGAAKANGIPVADLTSTPGDRRQRLIDFLTAALDQPTRVGDWAVDC